MTFFSTLSDKMAHHTDYAHILGFGVVCSVEKEAPNMIKIGMKFKCNRTFTPRRERYQQNLKTIILLTKTISNQFLK